MTVHELYEKILFVILVTSPFILISLTIIHIDTRPPRKIRKKLKAISKIEKTTPNEITKRALRLYIEAYEKQKEIDWGEYL